MHLCRSVFNNLLLVYPFTFFHISIRIFQTESCIDGIITSQIDEYATMNKSPPFLLLFISDSSTFHLTANDLDLPIQKIMEKITGNTITRSNISD